MKFVKKVDDTFNLKGLFNEHLSKFGLKHEHELVYLEDVRNFIEKKSQLELQYSQALSKLCNQFISKEEYQLNDDSNNEILIPEKWKLLLDQYAYIAEKKQVSSRSLLMHCEYFKRMKEQKSTLNQMALLNLKKNHEILSESNRNCQSAFKTFCIDQYLHDQHDTNKLKMPVLEKKLKDRNINSTKFKKALNEMNKVIDF
ncbi:FCH and double SH3 domains 2 [Brachionus plicatilis]|uniref:FCH and double SH3 domains 2 n=1 Tax=Brachionus plicatilis TaxID=10195 RepID=A0A3M7Q0J9_BRAPC|nr:FCH and double SH3 domains 2 [Brachionus plicatilis]